MKNYFKTMKTATKVDYGTYAGVILAFVIVTICQSQGLLNRQMTGMLVPICAYVIMAISLNLTVGILGELSLGHAGFMSVGAFTGIITSMSLQSAIPNELVRMIAALVVGTIFAAIVGFIVGIPVLRLRGTTWPSSPWPSARSSRTSSTACWWAGTSGGCTLP